MPTESECKHELGLDIRFSASCYCTRYAPSHLSRRSSELTSADAGACSPSSASAGTAWATFPPLLSSGPDARCILSAVTRGRCTEKWSARVQTSHRTIALQLGNMHARECADPHIVAAMSRRAPAGRYTMWPGAASVSRAVSHASQSWSAASRAARCSAVTGSFCHAAVHANGESRKPKFQQHKIQATLEAARCQV